MSRVTGSARAARNRRKMPRVAFGVLVVSVFGMWLMASVGGRPLVDALVAAAVFWILVFPLVWFLIKE